MMKNYILPLLLLFSLFSFSQDDGQSKGWRPGEMEVRVSLHSTEEALALNAMHLNGDIGPSGHAILYLIPEELEMVREAGFTYEILKEDLIEYYRGFWANRDEYHSYEEIIQLMNSLAFGYSSICTKVTYGTSMGGRELAALKISDNVSTDEPEPEIGFDGGIHGDEIGGPENSIRFAQFLCENYGVDPYITDLIDNREIWLYIMVNPDGRVNMSRYNNNGVDLNRDWGYMWDAWGGSPGAYSQVETQALRSWLYDHQFVIHTSFHSGTEYISYPWSYRPNQAPDHDHIDYLAQLYSSSSGYSYLDYGQGYNGMYAINGSSKDTYYGVMGSVGWSMEISNSKQPPTTQIQMYYDYNEPAMLAMIEYSGYGIEGTVTDAVTGEPVPAIIFVDNGFPCYNDPVVGDYHKFVVQGTYSVTAMANGYISQTQDNIVVSDLSATTCNFSLQPGGGNYAYRFSASQIPDNNYQDEGYSPWVFGEPDGNHYSVGKSGWAVIDLGTDILDGPGDEIRIYEADGTDESYTCYAGPSIDGPWSLLSAATGTASFDFDDAGVSEARFIRIVDDGDGIANVDNAGFDIDALEILDQPQVVLLKLDMEVDDSNGNGNGRLDPGETAELLFTLKNHGGLTASNTSANLNYDSLWLDIPDPNAVFGDIAYAETAEASITVTADINAPEESVIMMVQNITANDGTFNSSVPCHLLLGAIAEDFETGDFTAYDWGFTNIPWVISPLNVYEGSFTSKSANINDGQKSGLQITLDVIGYDDISFYRKVSSEPGYDFLKFFIDGNLVDQWSGNMDWQKVEYQVTPGVHTFKWTFEKDEATSQGYDCGWIDYIVFPSFNLTGDLYAIANTTPTGYCEASGGEAQLGAYAIGGTGSYTYSWSPAGSLSSTNAQFPIASPEETTIYLVEVDDGTSMANSSIKVSVFPLPETPVIEQQGDSLISSAEEGNQWYDSEGAVAGATDPVYYPGSEGEYYVVVTSAEGCESDPSNTIYFQFVGLDETGREELFHVYPNPVTDQLLIRTHGGSYQAVIYDIVGHVVLDIPIENDLTKADLSGLPAGIYLLNIYDAGHERIRTMKIVK